MKNWRSALVDTAVQSPVVSATATRALNASASSEGWIFLGEKDGPIQCTTVGVPN